MTNTTTYAKLTSDNGKRRIFLIWHKVSKFANYKKQKFKYKWKQKIKTGKHLYLEKSTLTNLTKQKRNLKENRDLKNNFSNTSQQ